MKRERERLKLLCCKNRSIILFLYYFLAECFEGEGGRIKNTLFTTTFYHSHFGSANLKQRLLRFFFFSNSEEGKGETEAALLQIISLLYFFLGICFAINIEK